MQAAEGLTAPCLTQWREEEERGQILTQMGKLVPGGSFTSSPHSQEGGEGLHLPLLPEFPLEEAGEFLKISYLVETTSPTGPPVGLCSCPATSQQSTNPEPCVFRGPEGGEGRTGWPEAKGQGSGAVAILSSSRKTGPFSQAPCLGSVTALATCPPKGVPNPHGVPQSGEGSGKEDHKDDEEDNEDEEDFDHEPPVRSDRLEVLEDL